MKQNENDQNHKKESTPVVDDKPNGKSQFEAWTAMAIGYNADPATMPAALKERDMAPRQRRPLRDFVFAGHWKVAAPLVVRREP